MAKEEREIKIRFPSEVYDKLYVVKVLGGFGISSLVVKAVTAYLETHGDELLHPSREPDPLPARAPLPSGLCIRDVTYEADELGTCPDCGKQFTKAVPRGAVHRCDAPRRLYRDVPAALAGRSPPL